MTRKHPIIIRTNNFLISLSTACGDKATQCHVYDADTGKSWAFNPALAMVWFILQTNHWSHNGVPEVSKEDYDFVWNQPYDQQWRFDDRPREVKWEMKWGLIDEISVRLHLEQIK